MQQLNPSEISALIKQRIGDLDTSATAKNEGTIVMVSDGIVRIHGLADAMYGEMIEFDGGLFGMAGALAGGIRQPPARSRRQHPVAWLHPRCDRATCGHASAEPQ